MLKTPLNYEFDKVVDSLRLQEYRVNVDDEISLQMYSNNGYSIIFLGAGSAGVSNTTGVNQGGGGGGMMGGAMGGGGGAMGGGMQYKVRPDSTIKIPLIGNVKVTGKTLSELEIIIENLLKPHFKNPFVIARISNKRIFVLKQGRQSTIYQLQNQNTTLFEVLAGTGGVPDGGNASKIKIIRGNLDNPEIYLVNLSKIDGIKDANIIMQANDIVYVDPFINYASLISSDVGTLVSLISSGWILYWIYTGDRLRPTN